MQGLQVRGWLRVSQATREQHEMIGSCPRSARPAKSGPFLVGRISVHYFAVQIPASLLTAIQTLFAALPAPPRSGSPAAIQCIGFGRAPHRTGPPLDFYSCYKGATGCAAVCVHAAPGVGGGECAAGNRCGWLGAAACWSLCLCQSVPPVVLHPLLDLLLRMLRGPTCVWHQPQPQPRMQSVGRSTTTDAAVHAAAWLSSALCPIGLAWLHHEHPVLVHYAHMHRHIDRWCHVHRWSGGSQQKLTTGRAVARVLLRPATCS